jgi:phosphatidylglycerophosphate synthase
MNDSGAERAPANLTIGDAMRRLRAAQKPGAGAPLYSRWVNRPAGRCFAAVAARLHLRPNQVTVISAMFTFAGLALVALVSPRWWLGLLVAVLLLVGYALDAADGQLARLLGGGSRAGEWLDHVVDATKVSILHGVVLISFFRFTDASDAQMLVALGYQAVSAVMFFSMILIDQLRRQATAASGVRPQPSRRATLQTVAAIPTDYATLCLCFALIGWQSVFRPVYTTMFLLNAALLVLTLGKWWREVRAMDGR